MSAEGQKNHRKLIGLIKIKILAAKNQTGPAEISKKAAEETDSYNQPIKLNVNMKESLYGYLYLY